MTGTTVRATIKNRADTAAAFAASNPILALGEIGVESDTLEFKIGDGVTAWSNLTNPYQTTGNADFTQNVYLNNANIVFEGATADDFETTLTVVDPTADRTITLPDITGTVITTGDTGTVTSTMIVDGAIVDADVNASAAIVGTKIDPDFGSQTVETTGDLVINTNTLFVDSSANNVGIGTTSPSTKLEVDNGAPSGTLPTLGGLLVTNAGTASTTAAVCVATGSGPIFNVMNGGNVGIGTTSPVNTSLHAGLTLESGSGSQIDLKSSNAADRNFYLKATSGGTFFSNNDASHPFVFRQSTNERMRIDNSGRLLVGTSTSTPIGSGTIANSNLEVSGDDFSTSSITQRRSINAVNGPSLLFAKSRGTPASPTVISDDDELAKFRFYGHDGNSFSSFAAEITVKVDGTPGTNDMPGRIEFSTTADGASSPTERMRIDSSGDVEIGSGKYLTWVASPGGSHRGRIKCDSVDSIVFENTSGNSERMRIDSSGRLLVGTASALTTESNGFTSSPYLAVGGTATSKTTIGSFYFNNNSLGAPSVCLSKSRSTVVGQHTSLNNDDRIGSISYSASDGSSFIEAARISAEVDGTPGTNDMPGRIEFSTTADGASSPTERMRIASNGAINIGEASPSAGDDGLSLFPTGTQFFRNGTATRTHITFNNTNGAVGSISTSGTSTAYNTSSDYRLKENVTPVTDGITRLQQLKPFRFNFIADPDKTVDGFLAHEVQDIVPEAITGEKDAVDDDGNPQYQGIDQSKLVPLLTAALQEAITKIETLEQRLSDAGIA